MQPSTTLSTKTASHSCPLAECTVESTRWSSSSSGSPASSALALGGSRVSSVRKRSRLPYWLPICSSWSRSPARTWACPCRRSSSGSYHFRTSPSCPCQSLAESRSVDSSLAKPGQGSMAAAGGRKRARAARSKPAALVMHPGTARVAGPHPRQQLQGAEGRHLVVGVLRPAQQAEHVLHVGGLEEAQAAVLHEGDLAPRELHLEGVAVMGRAEEHGLAPQVDACLPMGQHPLHHVVDLPGLVRHRHEIGSLGGGDGWRRAAWRSAPAPRRSPRCRPRGWAGWSGSSARGSRPRQAGRTGAGSRGCCARWRPGRSRSTGRRLPPP